MLPKDTVMESKKRIVIVGGAAISRCERFAGSDLSMFGI